KRDVEDANHTVYITGFPWLYTSVLRYVPEVREVFVITVAALAFLLWNYFRTWTGIWVPVFSGLLSSVWALGMGPLLGLNLDPPVGTQPGRRARRARSGVVALARAGPRDRRGRRLRPLRALDRPRPARSGEARRRPRDGGRPLPLPRADLPRDHRMGDRGQHRASALDGRRALDRALPPLSDLGLAPQGGRHDAGRGAPLRAPSLQRRLRQAEREVPGREPARGHRRHRPGRRHEGRGAAHHHGGVRRR